MDTIELKEISSSKNIQSHLKLLAVLVVLSVIQWVTAMALIIVSSKRISGNSYQWVLNKIFDLDNPLYFSMSLVGFVIILFTTSLVAFKK